MYTHIEPFEDRQQAGKMLAEALSNYKDSDCLILAIPRGGVVVAYEVSKALNIKMDVIIPRKIRAPSQPELAIGAIASWGNSEPILDHTSIKYLGASNEYIEREIQTQLQEINRRLITYRNSKDPPDVKNRTVILIDDGIATGHTVRAAALALRNLNAAKIILAVPVGPPDSISALHSYVDQVICLKTPDSFMAVGYWYRNFEQVSDAEVIELLHQAHSLNSA